MNKKTIESVDVKGKRVLVRVDFNVPLDLETGAITDDRRIIATLPTIRYLVNQSARVILVSHLGRPKGGPDPQYRMDPVARRLEELLGQPVLKLDDTIGEGVQKALSSLQPGQVALLENVRFYPQEEKNDPEFARALASLADLYVNDAFGTAHRAHASTAGVAQFLPAYAGFLMAKEVDYLSRVMENPDRPFLAILGGAKVHDKIGVLRNLLSRVDSMIIAGGMAYTFFKALGKEIGRSLLDEPGVALAKELLEEAEKTGKRLLLPVDVVVAKEFSNDAERREVSIDEIPPDWMGMDIGPKSIQRFRSEILLARTLLWNGPVGVFEFENFAIGSRKIAEALVEATEKGAISIVGGGDTAAAVEKFGLAEKMTHVSTGGGATLEFLEGKTLPGVAVLMDP